MDETIVYIVLRQDFGSMACISVGGVFSDATKAEDYVDLMMEKCSKSVRYFTQKEIVDDQL